MMLNELVDRDDLARGIADGLIASRPSGDGQTIHNYTSAALWTAGAWDNPAVRQCRGLISDDVTGRVVARPWAKFFNYGQAEAGELDLNAEVEVTDKLDGSLGIIHAAPDGRLRVATRGSFTSDQATHATEWLRENVHGIARTGLTPLVEIIYPENRIVCDYGDTDELRLLGAVDIETGRYLGPTDAANRLGWTAGTTSVLRHATLHHALLAPPRPGAEGMCVRFLDRPHIVKVKQADYVALHRIVTGLSERTVWEHMTADRPLGELLDPLPDELHPWVLEVWGDIEDRAATIVADARRQHQAILNTLPVRHERRDYAELAKASPLAPCLFQLLDGRDPAPGILKTLRPYGDRRAKHVTEATA